MPGIIIGASNNDYNNDYHLGLAPPNYHLHLICCHDVIVGGLAEAAVAASVSEDLLLLGCSTRKYYQSTSRVRI